MRKFSWQTMLIFVFSLLLAVVLLGLGIAHIVNLKQQRRPLSDNGIFDLVDVKQQRRQLSDNGFFDCVDVKPRPQPARCAWHSRNSASFSQSLAELSSC